MRGIRHALLLGVALMSACTSMPERPTAAALAELAPAAKLRFGLVSAPERTAFFVGRDAAGQPIGVTVDLARALAKRAGVALEFTVAPNSGEITDALAAGRIDAAFMPVDDERRKRVDFGPDYALSLNTFMVRAGSPIKSIAEVDRPGVKVIGVAGTTTIRTTTRLLKQTTIAPVRGVEDAITALNNGTADAFALTHDSLKPLMPKIPGARILDGSFHQLGTAIAVPKGRPAALAYVSAFLEEAKASGVVKKAFVDAGLDPAAIAPPAAGK
jgi:polar amino acid transport system substrate-binding protein